MGGTSMKDVGGAGFAGSSPPFLGRERAAVDVDPERRSPRYHVTDSVYNQKYRERTFKSAVLSMQVGGLTSSPAQAQWHDLKNPRCSYQRESPASSYQK